MLVRFYAPASQCTNVVYMCLFMHI